MPSPPGSSILPSGRRMNAVSAFPFPHLSDRVGLQWAETRRHSALSTYVICQESSASVFGTRAIMRAPHQTSANG